jgi:hypothetical protein
MFSTNTDAYLEGINHYVSSVDMGGAAHQAGLRAGHRLVTMDGRNLTNLTHDVVINLISSVPSAKAVSLVIMGANELILSSMRQKHRTLPLASASTSMAREALSGVQPSESRSRALAQFKDHTTIVEVKKDNAAAMLGPIPWHALLLFRQKFTLEDAIGSHSSRKFSILPVDTVNFVATLKVFDSR